MKRYLQILERRLVDFRSRAVEAIAISGDTAHRAEQAKDGWELENDHPARGEVPGAGAGAGQAHTHQEE